MTAEHYDRAREFWLSLPEIGFPSEFDTRERITEYLRRNPGCSSIALEGEQLIGAVLCGHDGRRGSLYHMAVAPAFRGQGIARQLVDRSLEQLRASGITSAFLFTRSTNPIAGAFWTALDWTLAPDVQYRFRSW
jgi:ribosomal protein S18 acetylase RimI-like enzyme